ncbi:HAD-IA family hydrolase [Hamadaea tsunoensis]|uniref:HAD-IA family hydrolase n=1 Tax=Hamadaea tsunoensis TaxID=53368 RepID=UPI0003FB4956|nr:HAD-IA family hydrolase [Hamadaea tsunoensis]
MATRENARALLIDFDGVLRHYDPAARVAVEARYDLEHDSLLDAGLSGPILTPAITGAWTRQQWLDAIGAATGAPPEAMKEWDAYRGYIDPAALAFVREVRAAGVPVALCTNATDDLEADLAVHGIAEDFDAVVNSSAVGAAKPSPEFYQAACVAVRTVPRFCLLVDDSNRNIEGARRVGIAAFRWSGASDIPYLKAALGL